MGKARPGTRSLPKPAGGKKKKHPATRKRSAAKGFNKYSEWFRSTDDPQPGFVVLDRGVPQGVIKPVQYSALDGMAIFEGDIVIGTVEEMQALAGVAEESEDVAVSGTPTRSIAGPVPRGIGITGQQFRWPGGKVPFRIARTLPNQQRVTVAIAHWEQKTKIRFVKRTTQKNFVSFEPGNGCSSAVGMRGGKQVITLGPLCGFGATVHEIGHAVGLWHEQSREDRTKFVRIVFPNIEPGREHNFTQHIADGDDIGKYDYGSIMHYPATAFSKNGLPTIVPLKPGGNQIGQRNGLSAGDIAAVKALYPNL